MASISCKYVSRSTSKSSPLSIWKGPPLRRGAFLFLLGQSTSHGRCCSSSATNVNSPSCAFKWVAPPSRVAMTSMRIAIEVRPMRWILPSVHRHQVAKVDRLDEFHLVDGNGRDRPSRTSRCDDAGRNVHLGTDPATEDMAVRALMSLGAGNDLGRTGFLWSRVILVFLSMDAEPGAALPSQLEHRRQAQPRQ